MLRSCKVSARWWWNPTPFGAGCGCAGTAGAGGGQRPGRVVPPRLDAGGPAPGDHPRSEGTRGAAGPALDGPELARPANRQRVRVTLGDGSHLPGSSGASWRGGSTPVERLGRGALQRVALGPLLAGHAARASATHLAGFRAPGRMVQKSVAHLLGCARSSAPLPLAANWLFACRPMTPTVETSRRVLRTPRRNARLRRLILDKVELRW